MSPCPRAWRSVTDKTEGPVYLEAITVRSAASAERVQVKCQAHREEQRAAIRRRANNGMNRIDHVMPSALSQARASEITWRHLRGLNLGNVEFAER